MFLVLIKSPQQRLHPYVKPPVYKVRNRNVLVVFPLKNAPAVRKNRYVILPADMEEAWKVRKSFFRFLCQTQLFCCQKQQVVKRNDETHEFCECFISCIHGYH